MAGSVSQGAGEMRTVPFSLTHPVLRPGSWVSPPVTTKIEEQMLQRLCVLTGRMLDKEASGLSSRSVFATG